MIRTISIDKASNGFIITIINDDAEELAKEFFVCNTTNEIIDYIMTAWEEKKPKKKVFSEFNRKNASDEELPVPKPPTKEEIARFKAINEQYLKEANNYEKYPPSFRKTGLTEDYDEPEKM